MAGGAQPRTVSRSVGIGGGRGRGKRLSKKESVKQVVALGRSLLRGSAARQIVPLAALAVAHTALTHFTALTQGELFRTVILGDRPAFVRHLAAKKSRNSTFSNGLGQLAVLDDGGLDVALRLAARMQVRQ